MFINVHITLEEGETITATPQEIVDAVFAAAGGDPDKDSCQVSVQQAPDSAVTAPIPPAPVLPPPRVS